MNRVVILPIAACLVMMSSCYTRPERIWSYVPDYSDAMHQQLQKVISVNYKDIDFTDVIVDLKTKTGINMIVTPMVCASPCPPITLELNNVRAGTVIMLIIDQNRMPVRIIDDVIVFGIP